MSRLHPLLLSYIQITHWLWQLPAQLWSAAVRTITHTCNSAQVLIRLTCSHLLFIDSATILASFAHLVFARLSHTYWYTCCWLCPLLTHSDHWFPGNASAFCLRLWVSFCPYDYCLPALLAVWCFPASMPLCALPVPCVLDSLKGCHVYFCITSCEWVCQFLCLLDSQFETLLWVYLLEVRI